MSESENPTPLVDGATDSAQAPSLCTQCGLCCTGAIHDRAVLDEDEVQPARAIGLPVQDQTERPAFNLPCPMLRGTSCSIFGHRPRVCSRYQCQVLLDYQVGDLTFDAAITKIGIALQFVESVRNLLAAGMSLLEARKLVDRRSQPGQVLSRSAILELRLRVTALELYLDKNFRSTKDGRALDMRTVKDG